MLLAWTACLGLFFPQLIEALHQFVRDGLFLLLQLELHAHILLLGDLQLFCEAVGALLLKGNLCASRYRCMISKGSPADTRLLPELPELLLEGF